LDIYRPLCKVVDLTPLFRTSNFASEYAILTAVRS
jgi:hypothetical protein